MNHLIFGAGNLGLDLSAALGAAGEDVRMLSRSVGFNYPEQSLKAIDLSRFDVIWHAVGAGSVAQAKENYQPFEDLHIKLVWDIASRKHSETKFIWFSTDYLCNEDNPTYNNQTISKPQSLYAESKWKAEVDLLNNPVIFDRTWAVRIGSLYGRHKPSFPDRLRHNVGVKRVMSTGLPINRVSPTPTRWIAEMVWKNFDSLTTSKYPIQHCGPVGTMTVADWGRLILGKSYDVRENPLDPERPAVSYLDCSFATNTDDIHTLWNKYGY